MRNIHTLPALCTLPLLLAGAGCSSGPKLPNRDFSDFNGHYKESSERRGRPCRATVDCNSKTDSCRVAVERGAWGKDSTGRVTKFEKGVLEISNEAAIEGQEPTETQAVVKQTANVTRTGSGYLISVTNVTRRKKTDGQGARSRMKCDGLVRLKN